MGPLTTTTTTTKIQHFVRAWARF